MEMEVSRVSKCPGFIRQSGHELLEIPFAPDLALWGLQ